MEDKYFVILNSEGDTRVEELTKTKLISRLNESYYADIEFIEKIGEKDTNYWGNGMLIIKGEIVVPSPKETVVNWEI